MILCPRCKSSYVAQIARYLQHVSRSISGTKDQMKTYSENCDIAPTDSIISILGIMDRGDGRLLILIKDTVEKTLFPFSIFISVFSVSKDGQ